MGSIHHLCFQTFPNVLEPLCPLNWDGFAAFKETMTGVVGTDAWDISPYVFSLSVLSQLKEQFQ